jgi:hypothetical protein
VNRVLANSQLQKFIANTLFIFQNEIRAVFFNDLLRIALCLDILKINFTSFPSYKCNFAKRFLTWLMHFLRLKTVKTKAISRGFLINEQLGKHNL